MSDDSLARNLPDAPGSVDADYAAIHAAIAETERGRWFLDEYARRHRGADTDLVLAAIGELEAAVREDREARPAPAVLAELATLVTSIRRARSEIVGRHGDPAASGEAAIAEFRHAAEEVRDLALPHLAGTDLSAQLSFQINRLAIAGDRLERSIGGLRRLLGLLDDIELGLRDVAQAPLPESEAEPAPAPPQAVKTVAPAAAWWPVPATMTAAEPTPQPALPVTPEAPLADLATDAPAAPEQPGPAPEPLADLTIGSPDPNPHLGETTGPAVSADLVADWAFTPANIGQSSEFDAEPQPPLADLAEPEPVEAPVSALERLEAREYGRQRVATAMVPPADESEPQLAEAGPPLKSAALDDLLLGGASATEEYGSADAAGPELGSSGWDAGPAATAATAEPLFDNDLFDTEATEAEPSAITPQPPVLDDSGYAPGEEGASLADAPDAKTTEPTPFVHEMMERLEPTPAQMAAPAPAHHHLLDFPEPLIPVALDDAAQQPHEAPAGMAPPVAEDPPPPTGELGGDTSSVLRRLGDMRTAIAALMEEVSERKAGRRPPPQAS